jgi:GntR family transcriptional regulator
MSKAASKPSARTPLHQQLYADLRSKIQAGAWQIGDLIPAESELTRKYKMSRITVRTALEQLVKDGFIDRFAGRGSFVKAREPETRNCLTSFTDHMLSLGRTPSTKLIKLEPLQAISNDLPFAANELIIMIERLRKVDGEPAALMRSYIPEKLIKGIHPSHFKEIGREQSLLFILEHHFGIILDKGEEQLVATCISEADATLLSLAKGSPIVQKTCLVRTISGEAVIYETALWSMPQTQLVQRRLGSP